MGYNPHPIKIKRDVSDRKGIIGGSSYGACQRLSTYKSAYQVARQFLGLEDNEVKTPEQMEALEMGHQLEDFIAKQGERLFGVKMKRSNFAYVHPQYPWLICHPDRVLTKRIDGKVVGVEIKSSTAWDDRWGDPDTDEVPMDYLAQCHLYMQCGICDVVWLLRFSNNRVTRYIIEEDEEIESMLLKGAVEFVDNCNKGIMPLVDDIDEAKRSFTCLDPKDSILGDAEILDIAQKMKEANRIKNEKEKETNSYKAQLMQFMYGKNILINKYGDKVLKLTYVQKTTVDTKKLEAEYPDVYAKCLKDSGYNMFR